MILIDSLSCVNTSKDGHRQEKLEDSNESLEYNDDHSEQAQHPMWGDKVWMCAFVDLDDGEGRKEKDNTQELDYIVDASASQLLLRGCSRL